MERNTMTIARETIKAIAIAIAVATILMLALLQASAYGARQVEAHERQNEIQIGTAVHIERITEDDPRWNCETMGNLICGKDN
jgi:hypothetical protein